MTPDGPGLAGGPDLAGGAAGNLAVLRAEGRALAAVAATCWDAAVPPCPDWSVADLVVHTGRVHRWVTGVLAGERIGGSAAVPPPPPGREDVLAWYDDGLAALDASLAARDPDEAVWTLGASRPDRVGWWARRMAQETAMHRWDAQAAAGTRPDAFDPAFAAEGIDEYLVDFLPRHLEGRSGTLHLHCTDTAGEWLVDLADRQHPTRREHAKADTALRGPASHLLLWLWNRQPAGDHVDVFGDRAVVDTWVELRV